MWNCLLILTTAIYAAGLLLFWIGLFFPNRKRTNKRPIVSIIIAARDEEDHRWFAREDRQGRRS